MIVRVEDHPGLSWKIKDSDINRLVEVLSMFGQVTSSDTIKGGGSTMATDNYIRRITDIEVLGGNTIRGVVQLGFGMEWNRRGRKGKPTFRLIGVDTPEVTLSGGWSWTLSEKEIQETLGRGREAKLFVEQQLAEADIVSVESPGWVEDDQGRILANVFLVYPGGLRKSLNRLLLEEGYAVGYRK